MPNETSMVSESSEATPLLISNKYADRSNHNASHAATPSIAQISQQLQQPTTTTIDSPSPYAEYIGYAYQASCSLMFAVADVLSRTTQTRFHFPPSTIVFCIMSVQFAISLTYILLFTSLRSTISKFRTRDRWLLLFRGCVGWLTAWTLNLSLHYLPSGDAMTIFFISPVMMIFLARIFLQEAITPSGICASVIAFTGIAILSRSQQPYMYISTHDRMLGTVFGLLAALCSCFVYLSVRALVTRVHFMTSIFSLGFCSLVLSTLTGGALTPTIITQNPQAVLYAYLTGAAVFLGQIGLNVGLKFSKASTGYLVRNLEIPFVYLLAVFFLKEIPSPMKIFGTVLVLLSAIIVGVSQKLRTDT